MPSRKRAVRATTQSPRGKSPKAKLSSAPPKSRDNAATDNALSRMGAMKAITRMAEDFDFIPETEDMTSLYILAENLATAVFALDESPDVNPVDLQRVETMRRCLKSMETGEPLKLSPGENRRCASRYIALLFKESRIQAECAMESMTSELRDYERAERPYQGEHQ